MTLLTLSSKEWVVIPADLRKKYGLHPGTNLGIVDYGGLLALIPSLTDPVQEARGLLAGDSVLTGVLVAEHRQELARER